MNKNILIGIGGVVLAGIGYGLYKGFNKSEKDNTDESVEITKEGLSEVKENMKESFEILNNHAEKIGKDFNKKVSDDLIKAEIDILGMPLEDYIKNKKVSIKDQDIFIDDVKVSREVSFLNTLREAAGKDPIEINDAFKEFLGIEKKKAEDFVNKASAETLSTLNNIAEMAKKDPKTRDAILKTLREL